MKAKVSRMDRQIPYGPFLDRARPSIQRPNYVLSAIDAINRWESGEFHNLAIFLPDQHGKSAIGVQNAAAWLRWLHPESGLDIVSESGERSRQHWEIAQDSFVAAMRSQFESTPLHYVPESVGYPPKCWSAKDGTLFYGTDPQYVFVDDPFVDRPVDWADSSGLVKKLERIRKPKIFLSMTRQGLDDFAAFALTAEDLGSWGILAIPALSDSRIGKRYRMAYPKATVLDELRLADGMAILPEKKSADGWLALRAQIGEDAWNARCQQDPEMLVPRDL
jgi:hypothetical protein